MKLFIGQSVVATLLVAVSIGFPIHLQEAEAGRGGYSGGSFRGDGEVAEGPRGGEAVEGPGGDVAVRGPQGNVVVGTRVTALPVNATTVVVAGQTYYVDGDVYYQPYYVGSDVNYVVVSPPQE